MCIQALQRGQSVSVYLFPCPCHFISWSIVVLVDFHALLWFNMYSCYVMVILVLVLSVALTRFFDCILVWWFWTSITINENKSRWNRNKPLVFKISTSSEVLLICAACVSFNWDIPKLLRRLELHYSHRNPRLWNVRYFSLSWFHLIKFTGKTVISSFFHILTSCLEYGCIVSFLCL